MLKPRTYIAAIMFFAALVPIASKAQVSDMNEVKIAMILRLCQYVTQPSSPDTLSLIIFTSNNDFIEKAKSLTRSYKIANHTVDLTINPRVEASSKANIVFVDADNRIIIRKVWQYISKRRVLLFTEDHTEVKEIMFNLKPDYEKGTMSFEFNRTNLIFEGFDIDSKIIELRGSEIDVRELYRQTRNKLEEQDSRVREMQARLDSQKAASTQHGKLLAKQDNLIAQQNKQIQQLSIAMDSQMVTIAKRERDLAVLSDDSQEQKDEIKKNKLLIAQQIELLHTSKKAFDEKSKKLDSLNREITQKEAEIRKASNIVAQKQELIDYKNDLITLQTLLIALSFVLIILVANAYRLNRRTHKKLAAQKEELQSTLDKLTAAQEQLVRAEKMASLGVLTAGIAHEINNPINFINSGIMGIKKINTSLVKLIGTYRQKLINAGMSDEMHQIDDEFDVSFLLESSGQMVSNIGLGVERSVKIINSLRAFARSDEEVLTATNIHENIDMALTILSNQYKYTVELVKNYGEISPVYCFPGKINQVFMNIISNAVHAITDNGHIWISTMQNNNHIIISIKDDGAGIPDTIKNKIFDPFFTTKGVGKGTGMGLSIAFSIIEEHQGSINFNSNEGEGTEFIITLPVDLHDKKIVQ